MAVTHPVVLPAPPLPAVPDSPTPRLRGIALAGKGITLVFIVGLGFWASMAPLESAAIATGLIEPETSRKTIQHYEGGIVHAILVKNGDHVTSGQPLIRLDDTRARTQLRILQTQLWDARAVEARLLAETAGSKEIDFPAELTRAARGDSAVAAIVAGQTSVFKARGGVFQAQAAILAERRGQVENEILGLAAQERSATQRLEIVAEEMRAIEALVQQKLEPRKRLLTLQREMAEAEGRLGEISAGISRAQQAAMEAEADLLKMESDWRSEIAQALHEVQNRMIELAEKIEAATDQLSRLEVRAPEDGIVMDLQIRTTGGVIAPGAALMDLSPVADRPIVTARLRPQDIDVVKAGQAAEVHLMAYSQRRAAPLEGHVSYVSADQIEDDLTGEAYYTMNIALDETLPGAGVRVVSGMQVQVFVKTGETTAALYALAPLLDSFNRAFRED